MKALLCTLALLGSCAFCDAPQSTFMVSQHQADPITTPSREMSGILRVRSGFFRFYKQYKYELVNGSDIVALVDVSRLADSVDMRSFEGHSVRVTGTVESLPKGPYRLIRASHIQIQLL